MSKGQLKTFQYTEAEKQAIWKELGVTESGLQQGVDNVLEWFDKQPHLAGIAIDKMMVEKLIILSKGSVEKAKDRVDCLYKYRSLAPELIQEREQVLSNPDTRMFELFTKVSLPKLYEGKRICVFHVEPGVLEIDTQDFYKKGFLIFDLRLKYDYWLSDIWVVDLQNVTAGLVLAAKLNLLKKASQILMHGLKWRIHAVHLINVPFSPTITQYIVKFFTQFASSTVLGRITIHESLDSLHEHIPREYLPEDFGGTAATVREFTDNFEEELKDPKLVDFLLEASKMISDETKRPRGEESEELAGSFRKLEFD